MGIGAGTLEALEGQAGMRSVNREFWKGRRVFLTGHTGFKGSWLSLWLQEMGADLTGYALSPVDDLSLFQDARIEEGMSSKIGDLRKRASLEAAIRESEPEVVLHLAAQPLVRKVMPNR